jgi:hypothetical protein
MQRLFLVARGGSPACHSCRRVSMLGDTPKLQRLGVAPLRIYHNSYYQKSAHNILIIKDL